MKLHVVLFVVYCLATTGAAASRRALRQVTVSTASTVTTAGSVRTTTTSVASSTTKVTGGSGDEKKSDLVPGRAEVYFLVDLTEKKTDYVKELKDNADILVGGFFDISEKFRFGLGTYTDRKSGSTFSPVLSLTKDADNAISVLHGLKAVRASGRDESQFIGLESIATDSVSFRPKSKRIIVWIGNANGKDPIGDSTEETVIKALKAKSINVLAIDTGDLNKSGQVSRIVKATSGIFYKVDKNGEFVTISQTSTSTSGTATATASATGGFTTTSTSVDGNEKKVEKPVGLIDAILDGIIALADVPE